jgi:hypothetical protein
MPATSGVPAVYPLNDLGQLMNGTDPAAMTLAFILGALQRYLGGGTGSTGIPVVPGSAIGTYVFFHVANSGSLSGGIPVTAKRWAVNFIGTGTANTIGGNTAATGGQNFSDNATPASAIAIACDGSTVADGFYSTT